MLLLDEPSAALDPRQRERVWEFVLSLAEGGTTVIYSTHNIQEAERHAQRVLVLADGELLFTGIPARARGHRGARDRRPRARTSRRRSWPSCASGATDAMRWLLLKDLQILRRSPLLVALLVLYPVIIATLIGFALSRGPDKPEVAFVNLVPESANEISLGGERIDLSEQAGPAVRRDRPGAGEDRARRRSQKVRGRRRARRRS